MKLQQAPLRVLVLFGSSSDEPIVSPIMSCLEMAGTEFRLEYVSAHRSPVRLDEVLTTIPHDLIIAGAGLAAHLPGVVASKVTAPVIGVPVKVAFDGLDALMSIVQMPPGIPVLTAPMPTPSSSKKIWSEIIGRWLAMRDLAGSASRPHIALVGDKKTWMSDGTRKARAILDQAGVLWSVEKKPLAAAVNLIAASEGRISAALKVPRDALAIFVPTYSGPRFKQASASTSLLKRIQKARLRGLWVGANNFVNGACGALQIHNLDGRYNQLLVQVKRGEFRG